MSWSRANSLPDCCSITDQVQARLPTSAFHGLAPEDRKQLVEGLTYYMPAMLSEVLENTKDTSYSHR